MTATQYTDSELLKRYREGDEQAFELLVKKHKNKVFTTIMVIVKDTYEAEDILQETFIKAIKTLKSGKYTEEGKFLPWVSRIAHNMAIDYFRKKKRYPISMIDEDNNNILNDITFSESSCEEEKIKSENHEKVRKLIEHLPEAQKEVLMMRHYTGMSFQEIADATGVSINTALGRMRYALINMRKEMKKSEAGLEKICMS